MIRLGWQGLDVPSVEQLTLDVGETITARSVVHRQGTRYDYTVHLGMDWLFRSAAVHTLGGSTELSRSADGFWHVDSHARTDLTGAVDIDLVISPFTNTLPIRRAMLALGESREIVVAWIDAPSLEVIADPQRYTRTGPTEYLFESLDSDFARTITVDEDGFVISYPGLFERRAV